MKVLNEEQDLYYDSDKDKKPMNNVNKIYPSTDCDDKKQNLASVNPMTDDDMLHSKDEMSAGKSRFKTVITDATQVQQTQELQSNGK